MRKSSHRISIKDVARSAGLSAQTVSMALSGRQAHRLRAATVSRCLDAARELGYSPNVAARAISTGRFGNLGLLIASHQKAGGLPTGVMLGIHDVLTETGLDLGLTLDFLDVNRLDDDPLPRLLAVRSIDALLVNYTHYIPAPLNEQIERHHIPTVWLNTERAADCALPDERGGVANALADFKRRGCAAARYFSVTPWRDEVRDHFSLRERQLGYLATAPLQNFTPEILTVETLPNYLDDFARRAAGKLAAPEAILTYKETDATHVLTLVKERGLRPPRDLLIATFSTRSFLSPVVDAEIITWGIPHRELGRAATRLALQKMKYPEVALRPELVPYRDTPLLTPIPGTPEDLAEDRRQVGTINN
jgi:DNA-binding LacI/PurR family transcriptional regulator